MPAVSMNYDNLVQDIQDYAQRNDAGNNEFIGYIPTFIGLAEKKICAEFKTFWNLASADVTYPASTPFLALPARWRKMISLTIVGGTTLTERTKEYIDLVNARFVPAVPMHWALWDYNNFTLAPFPKTATLLQMIYYEQPRPLSVENQENLLTREVPQLLLAACMEHASHFLKDDQSIARWTHTYQTEAQALKVEDSNRIIDRNTTVVSGG